MGGLPRKRASRRRRLALVEYDPTRDVFTARRWFSRAREHRAEDEPFTSGPAFVAMLMRREDFEAREAEGRAIDRSGG